MSCKAVATATILGTSIGLKYQMSGLYTFSGIAFDEHGVQLKKADFTWKVHYGHEDHFHDNISPSVSGDSIFYFNSPFKGELSPIVFYKIQLITKKNATETITTEYDILPQIRNVTVTSNVLNLKFKVLNIAQTTNAVLQEVQNGFLAFNMPAVQTLSGVVYYFNGWEDFSTVTSKNLYVPEKDTLINVYFSTIPGIRRIEVDTTLTGIDLVNVANIDVIVAPNPSFNSDFLTLSNVSIGSTLLLFNNLGQKLYETISNDLEMKIPVRGLNQSIYFIRIENKNNYFTKKISIY